MVFSLVCAVFLVYEVCLCLRVLLGFVYCLIVA